MLKKISISAVISLLSSLLAESPLDSVQFSHSVVSNSLQPHGLQHTRLPCLSPTPRACLNSCPLSWWCCPTISSPVVPFSPWISFSKDFPYFLISLTFQRITLLLNFRPFTLCYINFCLYILELYLNLLILINYIHLKNGAIYGSNYVFDL